MKMYQETIISSDTQLFYLVLNHSQPNGRDSVITSLVLYNYSKIARVHNIGLDYVPLIIANAQS